MSVRYWCLSFAYLFQVGADALRELLFSYFLGKKNILSYCFLRKLLNWPALCKIDFEQLTRVGAPLPPDEFGRRSIATVAHAKVALTHAVFPVLPAPCGAGIFFRSLNK